MTLTGLLASTACTPEAGGNLSRPRGSALLVTAESAPLTYGEIRRLAAAGIGELFVDAGRVIRRSGGELGLEASPDAPYRNLPTRTPVVLAFTGGPFDGLDGETAARPEVTAPLAEALGELRREVEEGGLLVTGLHFDLAAADARDLAVGAAVARALRQRFENLVLSAALPPRLLDSPGLEDWAGAFDLAVPRVYGQPPDAMDVPEAWDRRGAAERLAPLEELGMPYLLPVPTLGVARHLDRGGEVLAATTRGDFAPLANNPRLRLGDEEVLSIPDRRSHTFEALDGTSALGWSLRPLQSIQVTGLGSAQLQELRRTLCASETCRGLLLLRAPGPGENLTLSFDNLIAAHGDEVPRPDLTVALRLQSRGGDRAVVRAVLTNRNREVTDLAFTQLNFVELQVLGGGYVEQSAEPGQFQRLRFLLGGSEITPGRGAWREPDGVRFHVPMVASEQRLVTGPVPIRLRSNDPLLRVSGQFVLPTGEVLELPVLEGPLSQLVTDR